MSHSFAAARQTAPALPAGCWQVSLVPLHWSRVQGFESAVHAVPFVFFASAGQTWPTTPVQFSARSHSPAALRQVNVFGCTTSAGHVLLEPVHVSSGSQTSPEPVRQTVPAFPGGCWQRLLEPLQVSVVHGLPSSVHAVPFGFFASAGQVAPGTPVQFSARSHSPPAARQVKLLDCTTSAGQLVLDPVHVSVGSQASPEPVRQTEQPAVVPLDSPSRTDASHELLRTEPLHVKLREWLCVTPPLNLKSCAAPPCERSVCASPPPLLMSTAGAELVRVFDEKATFELPVTAPMCAWPSQLLASLDRATLPTRDWPMSMGDPPWVSEALQVRQRSLPRTPQRMSRRKSTSGQVRGLGISLRLAPASDGAVEVRHDGTPPRRTLSHVGPRPAESRHRGPRRPRDPRRLRPCPPARLRQLRRSRVRDREPARPCRALVGGARMGIRRPPRRQLAPAP